MYSARNQLPFLLSLFTLSGRIRPGHPFAVAGLAAILLSFTPGHPAGAGSSAASRIDPAKILSVIDRNDIELSGLTRLSEILFSRSPFNAFGTYRPVIAGAAEVAYLLDGRHLTAWDADTIPLSAVERIEILDSGSARYTDSAVGGVVNIVLRSGLENWEVSGTVGLPSQAGGDSRHASTVWGGATGKGRLFLGVDHAGHEEVQARDRSYSRARWTPGGSFNAAEGISPSGNTLVYVDRLTNEAVYAPLGDCEPPLTGVLQHTFGQACAYPWAEIAWQGDDSNSDYTDRQRTGVFVNGEHPAGGDSEIYWDGRFSEQVTRFRFAPAAGRFDLTIPAGAVRDRIIAATDGLTAANFPADGQVSLFHRFSAHGNRDWKNDLTEYDFTVGARGQVSSRVGYDVHLRLYRSDLTETGDTFVSEDAIQEAILSGAYNVEDPLSPDPGRLEAHRDAVRTSALYLTHDTLIDHKTGRFTLDGSALSLPGGPVRWLAGVETNYEKLQESYDYRDAAGVAHTPDDVIGSAGNGAVGDRRRTSALASLTLPVLDSWDVTLSGRASEYDDVGGAVSWALGNRLAVSEAVTLRASWEQAETPPSLGDLHRQPSLSYPWVTHGTPPVREQIETRTGGNPNLSPSDTERLGFGASADLGSLSVSADWFSIALRNRPARLSEQAVVNLHQQGRGPEGTEVVRTGAAIDRIVNRLVQGGAMDIKGLAFGADGTWTTPWVEIGFEVHWLRTTSSETEILGQRRTDNVPQDRAHGQVRIARGDVSMHWNVHTVSAYWNANRTGRYERWVGHDLTAAWRNAFGLSGASLIGGVLNVGNRGPSLDPSGQDTPFLGLTLDSVRGRTFFLRASHAF